jgi:hypothetical protein
MIAPHSQYTQCSCVLLCVVFVTTNIVFILLCHLLSLYSYIDIDMKPTCLSLFLAHVRTSTTYKVYHKLRVCWIDMPRPSSPKSPLYLRRISEPASTLTSIAEQPQPNVSSQASPSATSTTPPETDHQHTLYDGPITGLNTALSAGFPSHHEAPSLSAQSILYESEDHDWSTGWNITTSVDETDQDSIPLIPRELPVIQEEEFAYYPAPSRSHWGNEDDRSLRLARRRLICKNQDRRHKSSFKQWVGTLMKRMRGRSQ